MMKFLLSGLLMGASLPLLAQSTPSPARQAVKSAVSHPAVKSMRKVKVVAVPDVVTPVVLSADQLAVADRVVLGKIPCELATHVTITADGRTAGRFVLEIGREKHWMEPVPTSTGAVRLEDAKSGAVWLQLANKSMLMNQKLGKRMADACMNADQMRVAEAMERSHAPNLLDAPRTEVATPESGQDGVARALASATN